MKFKLDENFGTRTVNIFREAGRDVHTIYEEGMAGISDAQVYEHCKKEQHCLVTLDLDFSDVTRFRQAIGRGDYLFQIGRRGGSGCDGGATGVEECEENGIGAKPRERLKSLLRSDDFSRPLLRNATFKSR